MGEEVKYDRMAGNGRWFQSLILIVIDLYYSVGEEVKYDRMVVTGRWFQSLILIVIL